MSGVDPREPHPGAEPGVPWYLVTGAQGFIGRAVCQALADKRHRVRRVVRTMPSAAEDTGSEGTCIARDVGPQTRWDGAFAGVAVVVHLAARVHVMDEDETAALQVYRNTNTLGTLHLARQAAAAGVRRFVFMSTSKVHGESCSPDNPFTEAAPPAPWGAYALSKYESEMGLLQIGRETGMEVVIIRPPLVYGPGVRANFGRLVQAVRRRTVLPLGAIANRRSMVALDNLVDFTILCAMHPAAANQVFLVSDDHDISTADLVRGIAHAAGVPVRLLPIPPWALWAGASALGKREMVRRLCESLCVDITKARQLLGWAPPVSLEEGLRRAMQDGATVS